jgi:hypothetical protein
MPRPILCTHLVSTLYEARQRDECDHDGLCHPPFGVEHNGLIISVIVYRQVAVIEARVEFEDVR